LASAVPFQSRPTISTDELYAVEVFPAADIEAFNTNLSLHAWSAIGFVCSFGEAAQRVGMRHG